MVECAASAAAISSITRTKLSGSSPAPPYSSGTSMPMNPSSPAFAMVAEGNSPLASCLAAMGTISFCANSRAAAWIISCSSVSRKSMDRSAEGEAAHYNLAAHEKAHARQPSAECRAADRQPLAGGADLSVGQIRVRHHGGDRAQPAWRESRLLLFAALQPNSEAAGNAARGVAGA